MPGGVAFLTRQALSLENQSAKLRGRGQRPREAVRLRSSGLSAYASPYTESPQGVHLSRRELSNQPDPHCPTSPPPLSKMVRHIHGPESPRKWPFQTVIYGEHRHIDHVLQNVTKGDLRRRRTDYV